MVLYILLGLLGIVIIQLGIAVSRLGTIQQVSRNIMMTDSSKNQIEELEKIREELEKQTLHLNSIESDIFKLNKK